MYIYVHIYSRFFRVLIFCHSDMVLFKRVCECLKTEKYDEERANNIIEMWQSKQARREEGAAKNLVI